jgi:hypothetical protein
MVENVDRIDAQPERSSLIDSELLADGRINTPKSR